MSTKKGPPKKEAPGYPESPTITIAPSTLPTLPVDISVGAGEEHREALNEAIAATAGMGSSIEPDINAQEEALKARAAALEGYIKAGVAKCMIAIENHEIVGAAQFRAAIEALMRHLHEDHPENYLP